MASLEQSRRFERARNNYENLLLNAESIIIDEQVHTANKLRSDNKSFVDSPNKVNYKLSQRRDTNSLNGTIPAVFMSDSDKDAIIITLQEEIERLKNKLNTVIDSSQDVIQEAQDAQDELVEQYEAQLQEVHDINALLQTENCQLKVMLELSQAELAVERDELRKATRFVDRLKRRGREFLDVQRKAHHLVTSTAPLNMASIVPAGRHHRGNS